ncbi:MAG: hypothetical protein COV59_00345 [Candidatus Magasanikbacteria bacterium CG11_big_fil_rev_8_21_14_0_20_39_34]|uniref:LysM domain-containing protein n=1 Tax=Candidatus Magasanikbacteria bacterium CG11_big_fil_rev_8_21_14_0_20_39_34 TaxID=1974653 RepID=A0A2H0N6P4_9BACT|nr:MAG: hypothetical protein COV59_00345 [Candidatus Magasanikbacteria bacterium CG11_big_fil_rev_8_21_14_0_20_39_34]
MFFLLFCGIVGSLFANWGEGIVMKKYLYKGLLFFLRGLVYVKRAIVSFFFALVHFFGFLARGYRNSIGFRIYKVYLRLKRYYNRTSITENRFVDFFGRRGVLQAFFFLLVVGLMFPHSKLYSRENIEIVGRETLLYKMTGPGEQDFSSEETLGDIAYSDSSQFGAWKEGGIATEDLGSDILGQISEQELYGTSEQGSAITKPIIMPGASLPETPEPEVQPGAPRKESVKYIVQPGDVIGKIAEKYDIHVNTILWANNLSVRSYIRPGDELIIPPVDGVSHKVKSGDTLNKIANLYDAEVDEIIAFNNLQDLERALQIGDELVIPGGTPIAKAAVVVPRTPVRSSPVTQIVAPRPSVTAPAGSGYIWPTDAKIITQYFGLQHTGVDIAGPTGLSNYAARSGTVIKSQCGWNGGYGCYVILDHGGGVQTLYGHNSKLLVSVGQTVNQGDPVGILGSTGRSTGPHLHFEVRVNGKRVNPLKYIRQ